MLHQSLPSFEPLVRRWYVMQTKQPAEEARLILSQYNKGKQSSDDDYFEVFFPKLNVVRSRADKTQRVQVPLLHNLLFIKARREDLHHYKLLRPTLRFYNVRIIDSKMEYLYVPERQMQSFIKIAQTAEKEMRYYTMDEGIFRKGDQVRVISENSEDNSLEGIEGTLVKVDKDSVSLRVAIDGVGTIETWTINPKYVEFLKFADNRSSHSLAYEELERFQLYSHEALVHYLNHQFNDSDYARCQIFLRRMSSASAPTKLLQQKLHLSLLVCCYVLNNKKALESFIQKCSEDFNNMKASLFKSYISVILYIVTKNEDLLKKALKFTADWDQKKLSSKQQQIMQLINIK